MELRQFKQATKIFENATKCPIAMSSPKIWTTYAHFCSERKKMANARKVYMRAVAHFMTTAEVSESNIVWKDFLDFVQKNVDQNMTMETLQSQVKPLLETSTPTVPTVPTVQTVQILPPVKSPSSPPQKVSSPSIITKDNTTIKVDPSLAFVDTTGSVQVVPKAAAEAAASSITDFFHQLPLHLPLISSCPHLLFDVASPGEKKKEIPHELLENLSSVLSNSEVFQAVKDLHDSQRKKDRETLYRWQELIAMQQKEGSELFTRHLSVEQKDKQVEEKNEFVQRCLASQQNFIDIYEMDRQNTLRTQQISLENMKIPEISVTNDATKIELQRTIVGLILEAERLWKKEQQQQQRAVASSSSVSSRSSHTQPRSPVQSRRTGQDGGPRDPRQRRSSRDSNAGNGRGSGKHGRGRRGPSPPPHRGGGGSGGGGGGYQQPQQSTYTQSYEQPQQHATLSYRHEQVPVASHSSYEPQPSYQQQQPPQQQQQYQQQHYHHQQQQQLLQPQQQQYHSQLLPHQQQQQPRYDDYNDNRYRNESSSYGHAGQSYGGQADVGGYYGQQQQQQGAFHYGGGTYNDMPQQQHLGGPGLQQSSGYGRTAGGGVPPSRHGNITGYSEDYSLQGDTSGYTRQPPQQQLPQQQQYGGVYGGGGGYNTAPNVGYNAAPSGGYNIASSGGGFQGHMQSPQQYRGGGGGGGGSRGGKARGGGGGGAGRYGRR
jgi:uncharacterized membrane protein YgcG